MFDFFIREFPPWNNVIVVLDFIAGWQTVAVFHFVTCVLKLGKEAIVTVKGTNWYLLSDWLWIVPWMALAFLNAEKYINISFGSWAYVFEIAFFYLPVFIHTVVETGILCVFLKQSHFVWDFIGHSTVSFFNVNWFGWLWSVEFNRRDSDFNFSPSFQFDGVINDIEEAVWRVDWNAET